MFRNPQYGWCGVSVGTEYVGTASYLRDPVMDAMEAFITYFREHTPFNLVFDAEGYCFGIIEFADGLYIVSDNTNNGTLNSKIITGEMFGRTSAMSNDQILRILATECIADVERDFDKWTKWDTVFDDDESRERILEERKKALREAVEELKNLLSDKHSVA